MILISILFLIEFKQTKKLSSDSEDSSEDSNSNKFLSDDATPSKRKKFDNASCSRTNDSDSNTSDEPTPKNDRNIEKNEKTGNKGMSLMVIIFVLFILKSIKHLKCFLTLIFRKKLVTKKAKVWEKMLKV